MSQRVLNFGAGPAALPLRVLEQARESILSLAGSGIGILEVSHRSPEYAHVQDQAEATIRRLLGLAEDEWAVLFLQGGASLQFSMVPLNLGRRGDYTLTGVWAKKAYEEARRLGDPRVAGTSEATGFDRIPEAITPHADSDYLHVTTNNTIHGTQWRTLPESPTPLVLDASSDILSRPMDLRRVGLVYAGAQKNLGPAGVTLVLVRRELIGKKTAEGVPTLLDYATQASKRSLYNTPPCFAIHVLGLIVAWIERLGGLEEMAKRNESKARTLYERIDAHDLYRGTASSGSRSHMNVTFRLSDPDLEPRFLADAKRAGMVGLKGHRNVGGLRASIYNAMEPAGVEALASFMDAFAAEHSGAAHSTA